MSLAKTIDNDLVTNLKKRNTEKTATLRLIKNGLKNFAITKRMPEGDLTDEQVIVVLRQEAKKRKESIDAYRNGGREELARKEEQELVIIESYLPPQMSADAIQVIIRSVIGEQGLTPPYQFGKLMGAVVKKLAGQADGQTVKQAVEKFIADSK